MQALCLLVGKPQFLLILIRYWPEKLCAMHKKIVDRHYLSGYCALHQMLQSTKLRLTD